MVARYAMCEGCCAARYWFDFGYAHGRGRAKDINEFAQWFDGKLATINFGVTNREQDKERKWLEELGWHSAPQMSTSLIVHSISAYRFREVNAKRLADIRAKKIEEEKKKKEEELVRRKTLEERMKLQGDFNLSKKEDRYKYIKATKKITTLDVRFFSTPRMNAVCGWDRPETGEVAHEICDNLNIPRHYSPRDTRSDFVKKVNKALNK